MSGFRAACALAAMLLAVAACSRSPAPTAVPRYVVGSGYQVAGTWFYPREAFQYDATGIASVLAGGRGLTANGEAIDGGAMVAAHQTLQLPAIVRVTNLDSGLQALVRVNDRGPAEPSRIIALSRRAAELLGVAGAARVRVQVDEEASLALREQLNGGPKLAVAAAPRGAVTAEALAPPPGVGQSARGRSAAGARMAEVSAPAVERVPDRLPETVQRVPAAPGRLMIRAGSFGQAGYARQMEARLGALGARTEAVREARSTRYDVVAGPYATIRAADDALALALRSAPDARIAVE